MQLGLLGAFSKPQGTISLLQIIFWLQFSLCVPLFYSFIFDLNRLNDAFLKTLVSNCTLRYLGLIIYLVHKPVIQNWFKVLRVTYLEVMFLFGLC